MACSNYVQLTPPLLPHESDAVYYDNGYTEGTSYTKYDGTDEIFTGRTYSSNNFSLFFWMYHNEKISYWMQILLV